MKTIKISRILPALVLFLAVAGLTGCIRFSRVHCTGIEPSVRPLKAQSYEVLGEAESMVSNYTFLWVWTVTPRPDYNRAMNEMISEKGGDDLIDVRMWREKQYWILGTVTIFHIKGKVIRYIE
ncbi:MAG: hypothetical protein CVV44_14380 [Spirochaetae bacterium HGW-Spirochaetae-1]|jgi:hypothetical protein|nr:MAG: hypothetical protein CVV44_14380 [Spirochaetae bacterium HGW-Spirochaetae-1]